MTDEDVQRRVRQFVSSLLHQTTITRSIENSLLFFTLPEYYSPNQPYDDVCDSSATEQLRTEFVSRHLVRRPVLTKLFSFVLPEAANGLQRPWKDTLHDIFGFQGRCSPISVGLNLLFCFRLIIGTGSSSEFERQTAIDCMYVLLKRQHFVTRLASETIPATEDVSDSCTLLAGLPSVIANATQGAPSRFFETSSYLHRIVSDLMEGIMTSKCPNYEFTGRLIGKLCYVGFSVIVWRQLLSTYAKRGLQISVHMHKILMKIEVSHAHASLLPLFPLAPKWQIIVSLLIGTDEPTNRRRRPELEAIIRRLLVGQFHLPGIGGATDISKNGARIIRNAVQFTVAYSDAFLVDIFKTLLYAWSSSHAIEGRTASHKDHFYRSCALLAVCRHINTSSVTEELRSVILPAISRHLASTVPETRLLGMVVGEALVERLKLGAQGDVENGRLAFEYEESEETRALKSMLKEEPMEEEEQKVSGDEDSEEEEHRKEREVPETDGSPTPLDSDDEEDFIPMDMSTDLPMCRVRTPKYVRECLDGLRCSKPEEMEYLAACVEAAESLILKHPSAAREVAIDFALAVIHLAPDYHIEQLSRKRVSILVALAEVAPVPVANFLTHTFYEPNYSIAHRLDILAAIADAAQRLSAPQAVCHTKETHVASASDYAEDWRKQVEARVAAKTRRFASSSENRRQTTKGTPNRFASIAGHFFFPLLGAFDQPVGVLDLLNRDHLVLGRLLLTLACVLSCSENATALSNMARAMLDFATALRGHSDTSVRRGILFACAAVGGTCPSHLLLPQLSAELSETRDWLRLCQTEDPDDDCRQLAVWASSIVSARFRDFIQVTS